MGLVGLILIPKQLVSLQKGKVWKWINSQENGKQRDKGRRWPFTPQGERNEKKHPSGPWKKPDLDTSIPDFQAPDCETVKLCCSNLQPVGLCGASPRKLRRGLGTTEAVVREAEVTLCFHLKGFNRGAEKGRTGLERLCVHTGSLRQSPCCAGSWSRLPTP